MSSTPHPSLPARPPPSTAPFKNQHGGSSASGSAGARVTPIFTPRSVAANSSQSWQANNSAHVSAAPTPPPGFTSAAPAYGTGGYQAGGNYQGGAYQQRSSQQPYTQYQQPGFEPSHASPPQIVNPFPLPGQGSQRNGPSYDPEYEAQVAQWNSAYASNQDAGKLGSSGRGTGAASAGGANAIPLNNNRLTNNAPIEDVDYSAASADTSVASVVTGKDGKQLTVLRSGGGKTWQDPTLLEWGTDSFRLFVGNLAGEVTDESLHKAFAKYVSLQKARVIREKRTSKSKGFGFVSFSNPDDYFSAYKDMQGKYIGSHPVVLRPANTEIKQTVAPLNQSKNNKRKGGNGYRHDKTGAGIEKKKPKEKDSIKVLG